MSGKFKAGDKVRALLDHSNRSLYKGNIYVVKNCTTNVDLVKTSDPNNSGRCYRIDMFELATPRSISGCIKMLKRNNTCR